MKRIKKLAKIIVVSAIPAIMWASFALYALIQNNNQGEAFDTTTGEFRYIYLLKVFSLSFIVIFTPVFAVFIILWLSSFLVDKIIGIKNSKE